ncbi:hypothetical protein AAMO2058_000815000 [Amorphochlora amoebiformis]|uniref:Uncharacterized protein n=1 Tax=Amorphochlora amoebiformis TaxID=1561963 RepID=A0A7S0GQ69_9EUKA|mmetsp:Transcript_13523/g.21371  ORF Transcript_13523/g.21371 Transcript_13523/m.21371 type:complete len:194 (+) Transcript_13523:23-604(+)
MTEGVEALRKELEVLKNVLEGKTKEIQNWEAKLETKRAESKKIKLKQTAILRTLPGGEDEKKIIAAKDTQIKMLKQKLMAFQTKIKALKSKKIAMAKAKAAALAKAKAAKAAQEAKSNLSSDTAEGRKEETKEEISEKEEIAEKKEEVSEKKEEIVEKKEEIAEKEEMKQEKRETKADETVTDADGVEEIEIS